MKIEYAVKTDVGKKRDHNEDSYGVYIEKNLFFVCDGMGGAAAGDYASQKVVETVIQFVKRCSETRLKNILLKQPQNVPYSGRLLSTLVMLANRLLFRIAVMYPKLRGMGTTFTSVFFDDGFANVVNVGDSRVYRFRNSKLTQVSVDHSWVEELRQDGEIKTQEVRHFHEGNVITRAMGTGAQVKVDWKGCALKEGDIYLLCSDGLTGEIDDNEISKIIRENKVNLNIAASKLIDAANDAGGSDNTTVILVKVKEEIPQSSAVKMEEIITLSPTKEVDATLDSYIDKNYKLTKIKVPKGVVREKQKLHKNPVFIAVAAVVILLGVLALIKQPWIERTGADTSDLTIGDILIRTMPPGAEVKLYKGEELVEQKISPADFLSLEEAEYKIEVEKSGYEKKWLHVSVYKGKQEVLNISLNPQAKIWIILGILPGFDPGEFIYINDELCKYYGKPLTVQRVGMVGKSINVERGKFHKIRVGNVEQVISVTREKDTVKVKLENGAITIE